MKIARRAFPIILANAAAPLLGLADTAAIGQTGSAAQLGAIALGSLVFNFVYWGFGFLRMGTTGFVSQAMGAGDHHQMRQIVLHSLAIGAGIGLMLLLLQWPVLRLALSLMGAAPETKGLVQEYFYIRIWSAPAALCSYVLAGVLIGTGKTRTILVIQVFLNATNILLNLFFVLALGWGVSGIATGTLIAEVATFFVALYFVFKALGIQGRAHSVSSIWRHLRKDMFGKLIRVNNDIMIRTLALLAGFAWFTNQGAIFGDVTLAANHILLQFVSLSAFFLDGYANVVEMYTGNAIGAGDEQLLSRQVRDSTQLAAATSVILALGTLFLGGSAIGFLTKNTEIQNTAINFLPFAAIYIACSFIAFQLDGIFIGAIRSREMRNATIFSLICFLAAAVWLSGAYGNTGLWISFIFYVVIRGFFLGLYYGRIKQSVRQRMPTGR